MMAESTFEVKVPITVKGGKEGNKVGKQIGEKIASALNKSLKSIGIGKTTSSASGGGASQAAGFLGMSKGIGSVVTKLSVIGVIAGSALGLLKKSSAQLKGVLSIFNRAFLMFFRPFGDFLATLLRPLAIILMKAAVAWLKFTRTTPGKAAVGTAVKSILPGSGIKTLSDMIKSGLSSLASLDWDAIYNKMLGFGSWLWDKVKSIWDWTNDFNAWFWEKIIGIWNYSMDFGEWLWGKVKTVWNYVMDFGGWIWGKIKSIWNYVMNFGGWLWDKVKSIWDWTNDFNAWFWEKIKGIWSWSWNFGSWLKSKLKSIWSWGSEDSKGGKATGDKFISDTGMYQLHRGESVIPRVQNNSSKNQSLILKPTIQIMGGSSNFDPDEAGRRFSNMTIMELKSRGII